MTPKVRSIKNRKFDKLFLKLKNCHLKKIIKKMKR